MVKYFITVFVLTCLWFIFGLLYIGENSDHYYHGQKESKKYAAALSVTMLLGNCLAVLSGIIFFRNIFPQYLFAIITCILILCLRNGEKEALGFIFRRIWQYPFWSCYPHRLFCFRWSLVPDAYLYCCVFFPCFSFLV